MVKIAGIFFGFWFFCFLAEAAVQKSKPQIQVFTNIDCNKTNSCELLEFKLQTMQYQVHFAEGGSSFGTDARISYKTRTSEKLEDFAVVQFIRGCKFTSLKGQKYPMFREHFGKKALFRHPQWTIDSVDGDPMYNSGPKKKRHAYYRWIKNKKEVFYGQERPSIPELFTTDLPGTASILSEDDLATNISLQFRVCLFKTRDIPFEVSPNQLHFAEPLHCFDWASSYIYNDERQKFESQKELDPFCLEGA